jgi:hypothetical protein
MKINTNDGNLLKIPSHYFAEVLSGSGSESKRDGLSTFILHMMGNGLNHLSYDPIQCNPSPLSSSSDSISELLAEYSAQNSSSLHVFPYYVGLPVYCYLYKEGIHKTKFFTHDGLHLEFDRAC